MGVMIMLKSIGVSIKYITTIKNNACEKNRKNDPQSTMRFL